MLFDQPTRAVIHLEDKPTEATTLKRLALIFDEVHFVRPGGTTIREESLDDPSRFDRRDDGRLIIKDFNYFRDTSSGYRLMSLNPALDDTISALEESGVAVDATDNAWKSDEEQKYKDIRSLLISQAVEDDTWNVLTDTSPEDYDLRTTVKAVEVENLSTKQLHTLWWVQEPPAVHLTDAIASTSYFASRTSAIPLFNSGLGPMLEHQYRQFKAGIARLRELDPAFRGLDNFDAQFGEASFFVANTVFSSATLEKSSVEEIILYRNEMALARQEFVSKDLTELAALIEDNPWGARSRDELNQYVRGKLAGDVAQFEARSLSVWEKMYGSLTVRAGGFGQSVGVGGGVGGIVGNVVPHTSMWGALLAGALVGAAKELPGVLGDIVEAVRETREKDRTGIAYVAKFSSDR